jgi:CHAT domain-containing protein/Tfp pilus assembly protein PilF
MPLSWKQRLTSLITAATLAILATTCAHAQQLDVAALMRQLTALAQAGRYGEAIPLARRLVVEAEKVSGPESLITAQALLILGQALVPQGDLGEAETVFKKVLAIRERALGPDHIDIAAPLAGLAQIAVAQNRLADAEHYVLRAIAIQERALGSDDVNTAMTRLQLGKLRHQQFRNAEALESFSRALETFKKHPGQADIMVAVALNNVAEVQKEEGHLSLAESSYREALAVQEKVFGTSALYLAPMLNNLGDLYRLQGRLADAEKLARRTLDIREMALGADHPDVAASLSNLALVFSREGRAAEAEHLLARALAIEEKALGPDHSDLAAVLNNLALATNALGRRQEAELLWRRSLAIQEKSLGREHPSVAVSLDNLVALMDADERWREAEPLARRSLAIREAAFGREHPLVASSLNNLGVILDSIGRGTEAEPLLQEALAIRTNSLGATHPEVATSLSYLGSHYLDAQDPRSAYDKFSRATAIWLAGGGEAEIRANADPFRGALRAAYQLAQVDAQAESKLRASAFEMAQWIGDDQAARAISRMSARVAAGSSGLSTLVREQQDLSEQAVAVDHALIAAASQAKPARNLAAEAALRQRALAITSQLAEHDRTIARRFPDYGTLTTRSPFSAVSAQSLLAPDEALLLFAPTRDSTFVWTVTRSDIRWHAAPVGAKLLTEQIRILRCGLDSAAWDDAHAAECKAKLAASPRDSQELLPFDAARAHELYKALFGPIEDAIKDKRLLIVPQGALTQLPFQVLVTEPPTTKLPKAGADFREVAWLARKHAMTVLPAVSSLKALRELAKASRASEPYIGFGDPLLGGEPEKYKEDAVAAKLAREKRCEPLRVATLLALRGTSRLARGVAEVADVRHLPPLPETADELCEVARDLNVDPHTHLFLGAAATETKIKRLSADGSLARYRIVHFATHGALGGQVSGIAEPGLIMTPPDKASEIDDGYLAASEVADLKLDADWVILSACNTAAGGTQGGEALSGLARAFFYAGGRSLLVSHWEVASDATVKLITKAIAELKSDPRIGRAEALRRSMLAMIMTGKGYEAHPAFWAPFVLVGDGGAER